MVVSSVSGNHERARHVLDAFDRLHGSLVEFCSFGADVDSWARLVSELQRGGRLTSFTLEGEEITPRISRTVFEDSDFDPYLLSAEIAGTSWTSRLTDSVTVDMQGDPREFQDEGQVLELLGFLDTLAETLGREVILIPESADPHAVSPLARMSPSRHVHDQQA